MSNELKEIREAILLLENVIWDLVDNFYERTCSTCSVKSRDLKKDLHGISMAMQKANGATHE